MAENLIFRNRQAPGDVLMITAAVRELHMQYPGRFVTDVMTTVQEHIWANNPYLTPLTRENAKTIQMRYGEYLRNGNKSRLHFMTAFPMYLNKYFNLDLKLTRLRADLYFTEEELDQPLIEGPYWLVVSGGKSDFTAKIWEHIRWQNVVNKLKNKVAFVQVGGDTNRRRPRHIHQVLSGAVNWIGKTNFRELIRLVLHCQGVVCGVTCTAHLAGALNKPCVVVAGGREAYTWEAYTQETWKLSTGQDAPSDFVEHKFLHTIGQLDCCLDGGCWKSHTGEGQKNKDKDPNCKKLIPIPNGLNLPKCLDMITADQVIDAIQSYNTPAASVKDLVFSNDRLVGPDVKPEQRKVNIMAKDTAMKYTGKFTVCVLLYGDFQDLHRRIITSIVKNTSKEDYKLLVGCNEVCQPILDWLSGSTILSEIDHEVMIEPQNIYKYPFMRKMFEKVDTDWVVWFDDDSHVEDSNWLGTMAELIARFHQHNHHCFGKKYFIHLRPGQEEWIKGAGWYRNKVPLRRNGRHRIVFATGGFWAMSMEAIRKLDWPDPRIRHNGGDVMLGEALRQNNLLIKNTIIHGVKISDHPRRGYQEIHPGMKGHVPVQA